jgi:hypothetical protein
VPTAISFFGKFFVLYADLYISVAELSAEKCNEDMERLVLKQLTEWSTKNP